MGSVALLETTRGLLLVQKERKTQCLLEWEFLEPIRVSRLYVSMGLCPGFRWIKISLLMFEISVLAFVAARLQTRHSKLRTRVTSE